ncbi:hypothetical protein [Limimaricola litoreus]|uniref:Phasin protein n=1 Tax=Limimaricola litoreus TaxID=2955316 RepID=A0A9X2FMG2_9RHOB|nr:hypothetical protein [Limimaricola litoreus]MCP1167186.1 hypothetical protein [Limimaricola litoreus]
MTSNNPYALQLQAWRTGLSLWQAGIDMQMSMIRGFYGMGRSGGDEAEDASRPEAETARVDFAKRAVDGLNAVARPAQTDDLPV